MAIFAKLQNSVSGTGQVPIGAMLPRQSLVVPKGWLWCDGGTFSSTLYPELARILGNTYGTSSGTTYYLPDTQGRILIGAGQGSGLTNRVLGTQLGTETVTLTALESGSPAHSHSDTLTSVNHSHTTSNAGSAGGGNPLTSVAGRTTVSTGSRNPATAPYTYTIVAESSAATDAHNNMQPVFCTNFIIRAI
jgi:microcystin-dependent protein